MSPTDLGERFAPDTFLPFLAFIGYLIAALTACAFVSAAWLTARALWGQRIERARARFWRDLGQRLAAVVGDADAEAAWVDAARRQPPHLLRHCLGEYLVRTAGEFKEAVARIYRALGLLDGDLAQLRSRRWGVRMRALRRLAGVVTPEHRAVIAPLADDGGEMRLLVAQIIGRIGSSDDVLPLLASWPVGSRMSEYPVHVMVSALSASGLRALMRHWPALDNATIQRILLDAAAKEVPGACHDLLPQAAAHPSLEVRLAAARACGAITSQHTFALLGPLAQDDAWEVRAQAAKALGGHPSRAALDLLAGALSDRSFWVRQNAAGSLGRLGDVGVARLRGIIAGSSDRFARDAAEQVLTDLGLFDTAVAT